MAKSKILNFTKSDISKKITSKIGVSHRYSERLTEDLVEIIKKLTKTKNLNIKNFGTFKILDKKERIGRNPKTKENYKINARKSISFLSSKKIKNKISNL
tara:strand:+ start:158 stop:457 length:300 start_codon:yes stop_codon:yes gene_type:complete